MEFTGAMCRYAQVVIRARRAPIHVFFEVCIAIAQRRFEDLIHDGSSAG